MKMRHIVRLVIYLKAIIFIKVKVKYFEEQHLGINTEKISLTNIGGLNSVHNQAKGNCVDLRQQQQSICAAFDKQSDQIKHEYWTHLNASIDMVRLILNQWLLLCGHDESESSCGGKCSKK